MAAKTDYWAFYMILHVVGSISWSKGFHPRYTAALCFCLNTNGSEFN